MADGASELEAPVETYVVRTTFSVRAVGQPHASGCAFIGYDWIKENLVRRADDLSNVLSA